MAPDQGLSPRVGELIALFNRKSLDLPDGLFDRHTQFVLNGTPFEAMLGRPSGDPLVLMIARGPAGYRFALKAMQHAMPDARLERSESPPAGEEDASSRMGLRLSGHLRGTGAAMDVIVGVRFATNPAGVVTRAEATIDEEPLALLREARLRE